jgi:hypothetical protein
MVDDSGEGNGVIAPVMGMEIFGGVRTGAMTPDDIGSGSRGGARRDISYGILGTENLIPAKGLGMVAKA